MLLLRHLSYVVITICNDQICCYKDIISCYNNMIYAVKSTFFFFYVAEIGFCIREGLSTPHFVLYMYCFVLHFGIYLHWTNGKKTRKSCVCF